MESLRKVTAERDELQAAIFRLPVPPIEEGDGPDERVGYALRLIARLFSLACSTCGATSPGSMGLFWSRYCPACGRPMEAVPGGKGKKEGKNG